MELLGQDPCTVFYLGHVCMRLQAATGYHQSSSNLRIVRSEKPERTSLAFECNGEPVMNNGTIEISSVCFLLVHNDFSTL